MRKMEAQELRSFALSLLNRTIDELTHIIALIDDFSLSREARVDAPTSLAVGTKVRVFAACADMSGALLLGDLAVVKEAADPESHSTSVTVEILSGYSKGKTFDLYPQQCVLDEARSESEGKQVRD